MKEVVAECNQEFADKLQDIQDKNPHDDYVLDGSMASWKDILLVYTIKQSNGINEQEVMTMDDKKKQVVKDIFWDMNSLSSEVKTEQGVNTNGVYKDKNEDTAIIPAGFKVSRTEGMNTIFDGLVIQDEEGNEFVWVPVENFDDFKREHFGTAEQKWWSGDFVTDGLSANNMYEPVADGVIVDEEASSSVQEVQRMYKSVKDNRGFYIGRYEAGNEGGTLTSRNMG